MSGSSSTSRQMTLGKLFPQHEPSRKVPDPVFLGGPVSPEVIFALVQARESPGGRSIRILDDLYLAIDSHVVDHDREAALAGALPGRHGLVASRRAPRRAEGRLWYVQDATADIILRKPTDTMWEDWSLARKTPLEFRVRAADPELRQRIVTLTRFSAGRAAWTSGSRTRPRGPRCPASRADRRSPS